MKKILAAVGFFTRIPVWKITDIPSEKYKRVVDLWSACGWLTGGLTALLLWGALNILPTFVAVILAFIFRIILTGALHEDGLADFIDGFGGGRDKTRILEIMKDSNIGSYGVLGLISYFLLLISCVSYLPVRLLPLIVFAADPWSKFCASLIVSFLPYARKQEEAKNKLIYEKTSIIALIIGLLFGIIPSLLLPLPYLFALPLPLINSGLLIFYIRHKIGGYTGDCCGAVALICELSYYLCALLITMQL